jgi:hypothetical protein
VGAAVSKCFASADEAAETALVEGARCELEAVHDITSARGKREACVCTALSKSKAASARSGRRRISLSYEAPDIVGKARPQLRVIDASGLFAEHDWESIKSEVAGKAHYQSVRRLQVDNLDALAAPLARCAIKPGNQLTADLGVDPAGSVAAARVTAGSRSKAETDCLEKALNRGAFDCPRSSGAATLRVAIRYPD